MRKRSTKNARKWIAIGTVGNVPMALVLPYYQVFAGEVKMAGVTVLGVMVTASALTSMICGYPVGVLADPDVMGVWLGVTRFSNAIISAIMAALAGVIYDKIGPQYVFITFIALDVLIRMPLLVSLPETLHLKAQGE